MQCQNVLKGKAGHTQKQASTIGNLQQGRQTIKKKKERYVSYPMAPMFKILLYDTRYMISYRCTYNHHSFVLRQKVQASAEQIPRNRGNSK